MLPVFLLSFYKIFHSCEWGETSNGPNKTKQENVKEKEKKNPNLILTAVIRQKKNLRPRSDGQQKQQRKKRAERFACIIETIISIRDSIVDLNG